MDNYKISNMKLGFGLMRLPRRGAVIDVKKTSQMVDMFLDAGFTYFDTAFVYTGSESAINKALVKRHQRESYTLASKLFASVVPTEGLAKKELETSLKRTGAGYLDYYLLHSLTEDNYEKFDKFHLWDFVKEMKEKGVIRHWGFSFHGGPELLEKLLTLHPDTEFVQLQINYADWNSPKVRSRENYEVARRHNIPIVVMEPVKGGSLADPPENVKKLLRQADPDASFASWAIRFVASLDGILTVLSGMSNPEQMADNLSFMKEFKPLTEEEMKIIMKAGEEFHKANNIPCTACRYCVDGCPAGVPIPDIFAARNKQLVFGKIEEGKADYAALTAKGAGAADCLECGACEGVCPQKLGIIDLLKECRRNFE